MQTILSEDEMTLLIRTAVMAGMSVAAANRGSETSVAAEFGVITDSLIREASQHADNDILSALASDGAREQTAALVRQFNTDPERLTLQSVKPFALRRCDELAEMLAGKTSVQQADDVKRVIVAVCQRVAEANKEGGFLGIGGQRVSPEEQSVIAEVTRALKLAA